MIHSRYLGLTRQISPSLISRCRIIALRYQHSETKMEDLAVISAPEALRLWNERPQSVRFLDASWHMGGGRDARAEYADERLPGAFYFSFDDVSDKSSQLPHMLPSAEQFTAEARKMGLCNDHHIVVYTKPNCFSAARVWWMFQAMSHSKISVLDGGIDAWKEAGGPTEAGSEPPVVSTTSADFEARLVPQRVVNWQQVLQSVEGSTTGRKEIIDARGEPRFKGSVPETRPGLRAGHIPTAACVPFTSLLQENWTYWKPVAEIRTAFQDAGVDLNEDSRVISSCGSGVTACILALGMHLCGKAVNSVPVYDGSWTEWGGRDELPIESESA